MALIVKQFVKGILKNNNYILADSDSKEAVLIDCSMSDNEIWDWLCQEGYTLKYILLTHAHFDHIMGVEFYREQHQIEAYLYEKDVPLLDRYHAYLDLFQLDRLPVPQVIAFAKEKTFSIGCYTIHVIPTAGHTQGGVCYLVDNLLFSGDTLFHGTCGRTDLPESSEEQMKKSLALLFEKLPDEIQVYAGHGAPTTIGHERWLY